MRIFKYYKYVFFNLNSGVINISNYSSKHFHFMDESLLRVFETFSKNCILPTLYIQAGKGVCIYVCVWLGAKANVCMYMRILRKCSFIKIIYS